MISPYSDQVRGTLLPAINTGFDKYMYVITKQADTPCTEHPPSSSRLPAAHPHCTGTKTLLLEGSSDGLAERSLHWKTAPAKAAGTKAGKRQSAAGAGGPGVTSVQGRTDPRGGSRAFKARLVKWEAPATVCEYTWRRATCTRTHGRYDHDQVAPATRPAAQAPPRSVPRPPSPPPPPQRQQ